MTARLYQMLSTLVPATICNDWRWARYLDEEDRLAMVCELRAVSTRAQIDGNHDLLRETVGAWAKTAAVLSDPQRRETLLGPFDAEDFLEASDPDQRESL